jgi:hypothetical protein
VCDLGGASQVKLVLPPKKPPIAPPVLQPPLGVLVATASLKPDQIQDLAEQIGAIGTAAVGYDLKIEVRLQVGKEGKRPPDAVVTKINDRLKEVSKEFKLS